MYKFIIAILIIILFSFSSCYKYSVVDLNPPNTNIRTNADSVYLKSLLYIDYSTIPIVDSIIENYFYDSNKRVQKVTSKNLITNDSNVILFYYNSLDSLPYKSSINSSGNPNVENHLYTFNNNGKLNKDSMIDETYYYYYTNNKIIIHHYSNFGFTNPWYIYSKDTIQLDANQNPISNVGWITEDIFSGITIHKAHNGNSTFDNKKSPYYKIKFLPNYYQFDYIDETYYNPNNNFMSISLNNFYPGTFNRNFTVINEYNSNLQPTKSIRTYNNGLGSAYNIKYLYSYTAL